MNAPSEAYSIAIFSELFMVDQLARSRLSKALPMNMELSQFSVLNLLARSAEERSPAQLAKVFHVTRGAMTNTLSKLESAGYVHIRPDWDDARRKLVAISPAGKSAHSAALAAISPIIQDVVSEVGDEKVRDVLPVMRKLRMKLLEED